MSGFDAIANLTRSAVTLIHGDNATYRPLNGEEVALVVVCSLEVVEAGSIYETRSRQRTIQIWRSELGIEPVKGDSIEVTTGKHAGIYRVVGVDDKDEYAYWIRVA